MLLCIDIGNSSIKFGVFDKDKLTTKFAMPTRHDYTAEEIARGAGDLLSMTISSVVICSVVPAVENAILKFAADFLKSGSRFVRSTDDMGLRIDFSVETTGADRLVNSFAAAEIYGVPCVAVSFGTATTIDVVDKDRRYLGGLIAPGMLVSAKALSLATSKLPDVEIRKPERVIAQTTNTAIQSGIVYGQIAMVKGLLSRVIDELGDKPRVVATGGFTEIVSPEITTIDIVDLDLTLKGLNLLLRR